MPDAKPDVKRVRVRRTLLCSDGPRGGYPAGAVFDAPFPPGIVRELKAGRGRIEMGLGALEILKDENEPAWVSVLAQSPLTATAVEENGGITVTVTDSREILFRRFEGGPRVREIFAVPRRVSKRVKPWLAAYSDEDSARIRGLLRKRFDMAEMAVATAEEEDGRLEAPVVTAAEVPAARPGCLDGEKVAASELADAKRQLRDYATQRFGVKINARQAIGKMIERILALESEDGR
jgi:hypothetical protein